MQNPLRSEAAAFRLLLGAIVCAVLIGIAGLAGGGWAAVGVFAALVTGAAFWLRHGSRRAGGAGGEGR